MTNKFEELKETFWVNIYIPRTDNPNAPICNIEFVNKDNKEERYKYPVWRDNKKDGFGYVGKLDEGNPVQKVADDHNAQKANAYQPQDDLDDELPPF